MNFGALFKIAQASGKPVAETAKTAGFGRSIATAVEPLLDSLETFYGTTGAIAKDMIETAVVETTRKTGKVTFILNKANKALNNDEITVLNKALGGRGALPTEAKYTEAYKWNRAITDALFKEAEKVGIPASRHTGFLDNYFPQIVKDYEAVFKPGIKRESAISHLMNKYSVDRAQAEKLLSAGVSKSARIKTFGPIDFKRNVELPEDLVRLDREVMPMYVEGMTRRTVMAKYFGAKNEKVMALANTLPPEQRQEFVDMMNMIIGSTGPLPGPDQLVSPILERMKSRIAMSTMTFSTLNNMLQGVFGSFVRTGTVNTLKAINSYWRGADEDFIKKSGTILNTLSDDFEQYIGNSEFFHKNLYFTSERANRTIAGLAGKFYLEDLVKQARNGSATAIKEMRKLKINPERVLKTGLREDDLLNAAIRVVHETQFRFSPDAMPLLAQSPLGKVLYSLQSFNINQFNFMRRYVFKELKEGNPLPLMRLTGMGYFIGMTNRATWAGLTGTGDKFAEDPFNMLSNYSYSGSLGFMTDMIQGAPRGKALSPVVIALTNDFAQAAHAATQGNIEDMAKFMGRRVAVPALVKALPQPIALPGGILARTAMERGLRDE